jgi:hypothetical protein
VNGVSRDRVLFVAVRTFSSVKWPVSDDRAQKSKLLEIIPYSINGISIASAILQGAYD